MTAKVNARLNAALAASNETDKTALGLTNSSHTDDATTMNKKTGATAINMLYNVCRMKFYSIEGTDGTGKKTQIRKLYEYLKSKGDNVLIVSFPDYGSHSSEPVKMYLSGEFGDDPNVLNPYQAGTLFAADRICKMTKLMKELSEKPDGDSTTIIFDRYVQSNMLHQAGKIKGREEREKFIRWVDDFEFNLLKLPRPDKVLFMDMPAYKAVELIKQREQLKIGDEFDKDIHEANYNHLLHAYNAGLEAAALFGWTYINCLDEFDEVRPPDEIHELIKAALGV
jgi:dTMP kinase